MDRMIARSSVWITLLKDRFSVSLASSTTVILRPGYCCSISCTFLVTWLETSIAITAEDISPTKADTPSWQQAIRWRRDGARKWNPT